MSNSENTEQLSLFTADIDAIEMANMSSLEDKAATYGIEHLSDLELIESIISLSSKAKNAKALAGKVNDVLCHNPRATMNDVLANVPSIGKKAALAIMASLEFGRRRTSKKKLKCSTSSDVYNLVRHYAYDDQENVIVISVNGTYEVLDECVVTRGLTDMSLARAKEIFSRAVEKKAAGIILVHNHPSGDTTPSKIDLELTRRIALAGKVLSIRLIDHIIITTEGYKSLKEAGQL